MNKKHFNGLQKYFGTRLVYTYKNIGTNNKTEYCFTLGDYDTRELHNLLLTTGNEVHGVMSYGDTEYNSITTKNINAINDEFTTWLENNIGENGYE